MGKPAPLTFPRELTDELRHVLGMMVFVTAPVAHAFRDAGLADIPRKAEAEQAYVLHWLVTLVLEHGSDWGKVAADRLDEAKRLLAARSGTARPLPATS